MSNIAEDNLRAKMKRIRAQIKERKQTKLQAFPDELNSIKETTKDIVSTPEEDMAIEPIKIEKDEKTTIRSYIYQKLFWWWK
uniref:Uncharacterized protein n=1 Tax=viral metagenome TaxID=1070528 RepID=A0A6C0KEC3_9ZZZZ